MKEARKKEIWAIFFLCVTILLFVSLISFDPADLPFFTSNPNIPVNNFGGIVGAYLAGLFVFAIGKAGFVIPFVTLSWALARFMGRVPEKPLLKVLGATVLVVAVSSFLSLTASYDSISRFAGGGIIGLGFSSLLVKYFGSVGSYTIIIALVALSFLLATEFLLFPLAHALFMALRASFLRLWSSAAARTPRKRPAVLKPQLQRMPLVKKKAEPVKTKEKPAKSAAPAVIIHKKPEPADSKPHTPKVVRVIKEKPMGGIEKREYTLPPISLLDTPPATAERSMTQDLQNSSKVLEETLGDFGLEVRVVKVEQGPVITRYELEPAPGLKISKISGLSDNISLAMKAQSVRIVAPIPGKGTVGVEVPNSKSTMVYLREVLESKEYQAASDDKLTMALGKDISGHPVLADLSDMPHLLIAGATGSGKTVCVNSIIASMLFNASPDELKFLMVDPKMVELSIYNKIPHLLAPVVTDAKKVSAALGWIVEEMENRYKLFADTGSRNIAIYNKKMVQKKADKIPYIVVIIDELADLMVVAQQEIENAITRLAQLSRAVGIHIILATQRPSVDVITGVIKANFPARMSFKVASKVDSRTVLDINGADKLLGKGDMLFIEPGASKPVRAQGSLVSDEEIERIVNYVKDQREPEYDIDITKQQKKSKFKSFEKDEVYEEAVKLVIQSRQASVSMLQRRLGVGYTRAARLVDMMEDEGIVGPYAGSKPRDILVDEYAPKEEEAVME